MYAISNFYTEIILNILDTFDVSSFCRATFFKISMIWSVYEDLGTKFCDSMLPLTSNLTSGESVFPYLFITSFKYFDSKNSCEIKKAPGVIEFLTFSWKIKKFSWDNLFNYGEGNSVDFDKF